MDDVRCSSCGRRNARVEPAVYDEVTRQIKPVPPFGERMLRGTLLLVVACLALLGLEMAGANQLLSLVGSVAIFAIVCGFARSAIAAGRMPKVLSCQCNICGYRWFEKP